MKQEAYGQSSTGTYGTVHGHIGDTTLVVERPGAYKLIDHPRHTKAMLDLDVGPGVECLCDVFHTGSGLSSSE